MSSVKLMATRVRTVTLNVPRSLGYYGGVALAVMGGVIEPPLGVLIAATPLLKRLTHRALPVVVRFAAEALDVISRPMGSDHDAVSQLDELRKLEQEALEILSKAAHDGRFAGSQARSRVYTIGRPR
jgi:hypothetical protein